MSVDTDATPNFPNLTGRSPGPPPRDKADRLRGHTAASLELTDWIPAEVPAEVNTTQVLTLDEKVGDLQQRVAALLKWKQELEEK
jgi:hypothetical protein